jgi:oligopeptide/dipeptide ABC transporter ATP-binding protein
MVEYGSKEAIFENTLHPYTKALFSAVPVPNPHVKMNRIILKGDIPSPVNPPKGCKFHTRCESCMEICGRIAPEYKEIEAGHFCACHLYNSPEDVARLEAKYQEDLKLAEEQQAKKAKWRIWEGCLEKFKKLVSKKKGEQPENTEDKEDK